ncbi:MAG TPA: DUF6268 family outer membrane beta-barrel protein [Candidatus Cloacimonadota bacterium]|nr:DUF6268 family outer membrane beta-barrel protein [Candidatus Cloacimonadota bacterium]
MTLGLAANLEQNNHHDFVSEDLKGTYTNLFYTRGFGKKCFITSYQSIGWFSDKSLKLNANQMKYYQISKLGYQVKKNLNLSVGFLSSTNYYEPLIVPFVGLIWSHKNFLLDIEAPLHIDCHYQLNSRLKLIHKLESDIKSYRKEDGQILQINSLSGKSGIDYSLSKHIILNAEYIYYQRKEFFLQSSENQKIKKDMNPLISFNLKIKA